MQKPKYDKYKPLPNEIISKACHGECFSGYVIAKICFHSTSYGIVYIYETAAKATDTPMQIYKDAGIETLYEDVTFASVNLCNVTVQVI